MGWNSITIEKHHDILSNSTLLRSISDYYFVHSFYCNVTNSDSTIASSLTLALVICPQLLARVIILAYSFIQKSGNVVTSWTTYSLHEKAIIPSVLLNSGTNTPYHAILSRTVGTLLQQLRLHVT